MVNLLYNCILGYIKIDWSVIYEGGCVVKGEVVCVVKGEGKGWSFKCS